MAERQISIALLLKDLFTPGARNAENALRGINKAADQLSRGLNTIKNVAATALAGFIGFEGIRNAVNEAIKIEDAATRLKTVLGEDIAQFEEIAKLADEISAASIFDDTDLKRAAARIIQIQGGTKGLANTLQVATDLAAELGISVEDAATQILKMTELGNVSKELAILAPGLKALSEEALRAGEGVTLLGTNLRNRARDLAATSGGALKQFANQAQNELGLVGDQILKLLADIAPAALNAIRAIREFFTSTEAKVFIDLIGQLLRLLVFLGPTIVRVTVLYGGFKLALSAVNLAMNIGAKGIGAYAASLGTLPRLFALATSAMLAFQAGQAIRSAIEGPDNAPGVDPQREAEITQRLTAGEKFALFLESTIPGFAKMSEALGSFSPTDSATRRLTREDNVASGDLKKKRDESIKARVDTEEQILKQIARIREKFDDNEAERSRARRLDELRALLDSGDLAVDEFVKKTRVVTGQEILAEADKIKAALDPIFDLPERFELFGETFDTTLENAQKIIDLRRSKLNDTGQPKFDTRADLERIAQVTEKLTALDDKRTKVLIQIDALEASILQKRTEQSREAAQLLNDLQVRQLQAQAELLDGSGRTVATIEATLFDLENRHAKELLDLRKQFNLLGSGAVDDLREQLVETQRLEAAAARLNAVRGAATEVVQKASEFEARFREQADLSAQLFQSGQIGAAQAFTRNRDAAQGLNEKIAKQDELLKQLIATYPDLRDRLEEQITQMERLRASMAIPADDFNTFVNSVEAGVASVSSQFDQLFELGNAIGERLGSALGDGLSDVFVSIVQGTQTAADAFRSFAASVIGDIGRMLVRFAILRAVSGFLQVGATTAGGASSGSPIAGLLGFADGGLVGGPDLGRDSQLIAVRGKEYVLRPEVVRRLGVPWLDLLNRGHWLNLPAPSMAVQAPGGVRGYAQGGAVQPITGTDRPVTHAIIAFDNSDYDKMMHGGLEQRIIERMARNPSAYNAALQRGGA